MFTGLIEAIGHVLEVKASGSSSRVAIATSLAGGISAGDSMAVNGACLTMVNCAEGVINADIGPETLRVTALGELRPGSVVNLERPLRADSRLGGHFVQGHVDTTGRIETLETKGDFWLLTVSFPASVRHNIVPKGSIAVDGISLTVAGLERNRFTVQVIPFTWEHTNLKSRGVGDRVNLECDIVGKYVIRALELMHQAEGTSPPMEGHDHFDED